MTARRAWEHDGPCLYCEHGPACMACELQPPAGVPLQDAPVCGNCAAEIRRQEIAADPYYRGDYVAMFGDDE